MTGTPVIALTATASPARQKTLTRALGMEDPVVISISPNRPNIHMSVIQRPKSSLTSEHLEEILNPMVQVLKEDPLSYPQTLFYTDTPVISAVYRYLEKELGEKQYIGEPKPENRLFAQAHKEYTEDMKQTVVQLLGEAESKLPVFTAATVHLGMGLNCRNCTQVRKTIISKKTIIISANNTKIIPNSQNVYNICYEINSSGSQSYIMITLLHLKIHSRSSTTSLLHAWRGTYKKSVGIYSLVQNT